MRIYKCNKNQRERRDSDLIGKLISLPTQHRLDSTVGEIAKEYNIAPYRTYITSVRPVYDPSGDYVLGGASYTLSVMEYDDHNYGYQKVSSFVGQKYRMLTNGIWGEWTKNVPTSDLGYIDCSVTTGANIQVSIPGAPPTNLGYIPVIVGHGTTSSALDNVFYDAGAWRIYSTHAQTVVIRFYKYPV